MIGVAYRRWSFTRGFNCRALTGKILVVWWTLMGAWSSTRGGRTWRFDCIHICLAGFFLIHKRHWLPSNSFFSGQKISFKVAIRFKKEECNPFLFSLPLLSSSLLFLFLLLLPFSWLCDFRVHRAQKSFLLALFHSNGCKFHTG